jgi:hypothetical protein
MESDCFRSSLRHESLILAMHAAFAQDDRAESRAQPALSNSLIVLPF